MRNVDDVVYVGGSSDTNAGPMLGSWRGVVVVVVIVEVMVGQKLLEARLHFG